ncbi:MAG: hypothetical protein Q8R83_03560 [Legionellaceae bacterium]|nr:hypothetical protein [Legionellaceae bacterium]
MNIKASHIDTNRVDSELFDTYLREETRLLKNWFDNKLFVEEGLEVGSEIEFFILNPRYKLELKNIAFVDQVSCAQLVTECGAAQLEINSSHYNLTLDCLTRLHQNILNLWQKAYDGARNNEYHLALIGSMPVADDLHNKICYLTKLKRYELMNENVGKILRRNPFSITLDGHEHLELHEPISMCLGGLISSLQLHLKVPLSQSVRYYNTTQAISAPMLALCANSPYFNGQDIWSETRICLYEQLFLINKGADGLKHVDSFGKKYLSSSLFELFEQNLGHSPRLLPEVSPSLPMDKMFHVRRQNGTIYRWNRPVIDFVNQKPHLRIEHRGPSTGPTIIDMIANAAFFYGIVNYFVNQSTPIERLLDFECAKGNFYQAARFGLEAQLTWFDGRTLAACDLLKELVPLASKGLLLLNIAKSDVDYYLNIIEQRLISRQNGAVWQQKFIEKYGKDFSNMLQAYVQNQNNDIPVSNWKI